MTAGRRCLAREKAAVRYVDQISGELIRGPSQPVLVRDGKVRPDLESRGQHFREALRRRDQRVRQISKTGAPDRIRRKNWLPGKQIKMAEILHIPRSVRAPVQRRQEQPRLR